MNEQKYAELKQAVVNAALELADADLALYEFECDPENNQFDDVGIAQAKLEMRLLTEAHYDCTGPDGIGRDEYIQFFSVNGRPFKATLKVSYSQFDVACYIVDDTEFTVVAVQE